MSATILLKQTTAHRSTEPGRSVPYYLTIAGIVLALGVAWLMAGNVSSAGALSAAAPSVPSLAVSNERQKPELAEISLSPVMKKALSYVAQRYRVSATALTPVFEAAQAVGQERRIDPLLIVAIIAIESRFNPFAESPMGAQGLMQVIPRFHMDKVPEDAGERPFLDPETNIRIGATVLAEAIRLRGSLTGGLQFYAGSSDPAGGYANRVLAEKARLEQAAQRGAAPSA